MADYFLGAPFGSSITTPSWLPALTHMRMGYDQHFSFGIQHQLRKKMSLEVDYAGNRGRFQESSDRLMIRRQVAEPFSRAARFPCSAR